MIGDWQAAMGREELTEAVIEYQTERLRRDYRDFVSDPNWKVVGHFFFDRVYGTRDKSRRDEAGRRLFKPARKILGEEIGGNLAKLLELNEITDRLDRALVDEMMRAGVAKFSQEAYEEAYRLCDNYKERARQIELSLGALRYFHRLAFVPGVGVGLALLKPYAAIMKATLVYEFLRDGYRGFRTIPDIEPFVKAVEEREIARLDRIYRKTNGSVVPSRRTTRRTTR